MFGRVYTDQIFESPTSSCRGAKLRFRNAVDFRLVHSINSVRTDKRTSARVVVERVCADLGEEFVEVDITDDDDLLRQFQIEIPVTFVDGEKHDIYFVSEERLRTALAR